MTNGSLKNNENGFGRAAASLIWGALVFSLWLPPPAEAYQLISSTTMNGGSNGDDTGVGILADQTSSIWVVGKVYETVGQKNAWVAKYNSSLLLLASTTVNGSSSGWDTAQDIARDQGGNIWVAGMVVETGTLGNAWLAKYNSSLVLQSSVSVNGSLNADDAAQGVAVDQEGNIWVAGSTNDSPGPANIWLAKYSSSMVLLGSATFNGPADLSDGGCGISVDASGNAWVNGSIGVAGGQSIWLGKYDTSLVLLASATINGASSVSHSSYHSAFDAAGNYWVTGEVKGAEGGQDILLAKYTPALTLIASTTVNGAANVTDYGFRLAADAYGYMWIVGGIQDTASTDIWLARYNSSLVMQSSAAINGPAGTNDQGWGLSIEPSGDAWITGDVTTAAGNRDVYIARYRDNYAAPAAIGALAAAPASYVGALDLNWPAPGNDGNVRALGTGSSFYIQYATSAVVSWSTAAAQVVQSTSGVTPSILVRYTIGALDPGTTYYAAVWHKDEAGNLSGLSNIASGYAKPFPGGSLTRTDTGADTWQLKFNSASNGPDAVNGVALDASGNIYASGLFYNGSNQDMGIHKYATDGTLLLAKYYNGVDNCSEVGEPSVAVDKTSGSFYLLGGECKTNGGHLDLIAKYDSSGTRLWVRRLPGLGTTIGQGFSRVAIDDSGNIYAAGSLSNASNGRDMYVGKFDGDGNELWSNINNTTVNTEQTRGVVVVGTSVYSAGYSDQASLGQSNNGIARKMSASGGVTQWTSVFNSTYSMSDSLLAVAADGDGNVYWGGQQQISGLDRNLVLQKRDPEGGVIWSNDYDFSSVYDGAATDVVVGPDGYVYVGGYLRVSATSVNIKVARFAPDGLLLGQFDYNPADGVNNCDALVSSGTYLFVGGSVYEGGSSNSYLRKLGTWEVNGSTPPSAGIITPANGSSTVQLAQITGTSSGPVTVDSVTISLMSVPDGLYWNGTAWVGSQVWLTASLWPSSWSYSNVPALVHGSSYSVTARARDIVRNWSVVYSTNMFTAYVTAPVPSAPVLSAAANGVSSITWSWGTAAYAAGYRVMGPAEVNLSGDLAQEVRSWTEEGLSPNIAYSRQAAAFNAFGASTSTVHTRYTLAAIPSGLEGSVYITSSAFSWNLNGNPAGTTAQVYRSTDSSTYSPVFSGPVLDYTDTGLQVCSTYYYRARNANGDGLPTAYTSPVQVFTGNFIPLPPNGLEAASLAGRRIALNWQPSPDPWLAYYRLYTDGGSGLMDYGAPLAVLPSTASVYITDVLVSSPSYMFALRAVNRCGTGETNTRVLASASALNNLTGVRAAIKEPHSGRKVSGNRLTVMAEIILGEDFQVSEIRFQYKASAASVWTDIVSANANHPNPDSRAPYFVHWDVSALASGNYDLRAVASDNGGYADEGAPSVTVTVDNVDFDVKETVQGDGKVKKEQVINNAVASVVQAADAEQSWVTKVSIPSEAVNFSTVTLSIISNPLGAPAQGASLNPVGQTAEITLSNAQHNLDNGQKAEIALTYPDADGDGLVDGTSYRVERLKIFSYDALANVWQQDLECSLDKENRRVIGRTPHFSYFAVFAPAAIDLNSARAYPNPWRPGSGGGFDAAGVTFDNLMSGGSVRIFTIAGELVRELAVTAADAGVKTWNGRNTSGSKAASGVYIVRISSGGKEKILKLAVER